MQSKDRLTPPTVRASTFGSLYPAGFTEEDGRMYMLLMQADLSSSNSRFHQTSQPRYKLRLSHSLISIILEALAGSPKKPTI